MTLDAQRYKLSFSCLRIGLGAEVENTWTLESVNDSKLLGPDGVALGKLLNSLNYIKSSSLGTANIIQRNTSFFF